MLFSQLIVFFGGGGGSMGTSMLIFPDGITLQLEVFTYTKRLPREAHYVICINVILKDNYLTFLTAVGCHKE